MRKTFTTPGGHTAIMECREGTNDAMVCEAVIERDEYAIAELDEVDEAVDIGAHIGAWTVAILLDYPDAWVDAVEPLPDNVMLLTENLDLNGVADRCAIMPFAFAPEDVEHVKIAYDFTGDDSAEMHRFIGNQRMEKGTDYKLHTAPAIHASDLFADEPDVVKLDCEGGEAALIGADLSHVGVLTGEYHVPRGPLYSWLIKTHRVAMGNDPDFGAFRAVLK